MGRKWKTSDDTSDRVQQRSDGVMVQTQVTAARHDGLALSYCPVQIGWVPADVTDDITGARHSAVATKPQVNALRRQLRLRAWTLGDLATYRALLDDPKVWAHMPEAYPDPLTDEAAAALIELSNASNHHQVFAVLFNAEIVGQARLEYDVDPQDASVAEISYWLGRAHWGKGIGSDLVSLFAERCLDENIGISKLIAKVHTDNPASAAVLRKAGFSLIGPDPKRKDWVLYTRNREI